jgi:hypothetical protein
VSSTKSRKDTRAVIALRARYRSPATFEYVQEACCDVSVGGMFIKSDSPAAAGTLIKLECEAEGDGGKIRGVARVVWLRLEANEHGPTGMGVKFVKLESGSKDVISKLVQRLADAGVQPRSISSPPEAASGEPASSSVGSAAPGSAAPTSGAKTSQPVSSAPSPGAATPISAKPAKNAAPTGGTKPKVQGKPAASPTPAAPAAQHSPAAQPATVAGAANIEPVRPHEADPPTQPMVPHQPAAKPAQPVQPVQPAKAAQPAVAAAAAHAATPATSAARGNNARLLWLGGLAAAAVLVALLFSDNAPGTATHGGGQSQAPASAPNEATAASPPAPNAAPTAPAPNTAQQATAPAAQVAAASPEPALQAPATPDSAAIPAAPPTAAATPDSAAPGKVAAAKGDYVIDFVSRPNGATISVDDQSLVAPGEMNLGPISNRVKVSASKTGFQPSSAWVDREGFQRVGGVMRRRVYMTLPVEDPTTAPAKPNKR